LLLCLWYTCWSGLLTYRIFRDARFPPQGYPILVATRVKRGRAARIEGAKFVLGTLVSVAVLTYLLYVLIQGFLTVAPLHSLFR
jgi:hypothetical protein